jgi:hypothetical protein
MKDLRTIGSSPTAGKYALRCKVICGGLPKSNPDYAKHSEAGPEWYGLYWQITPIALTKAVTDPDTDAAKRAFDAMMQMKKIDIAAIEAARRG